VVVYEHDFPKIYLGGGINAFLRESVIATIEVKSTLSKDDVRSAAVAAQNIKKLSSSGRLTVVPVATYIVAFKGPAKIETAFSWIAEVYKDLELEDPDLEAAPDRRFFPSPSIDGIFLLGTGACIFENNVGFVNVSTSKKATWSVAQTDRGSLFLLFLNMLGLVQGSDYSQFNPYFYAASFQAKHLSFHKIVRGNIETFAQPIADPGT
jgi:hypothetical protein